MNDELFSARYTSLYTCPAAPRLLSSNGVNEAANRFSGSFLFLPRLHCFNLAMKAHYNVSKLLKSVLNSAVEGDFQLSATRFSNHPRVPPPRISVMCPNSPTPNLPNMVIWVTKIHTPSPPLPLHRPRHFDPVSLEMLLPCLDVRP